MFRPTTDSRIYLLDEDDRRTAPDGPAVIGPGGRREDISPVLCEVIQHVLEAMRAGRAVKISPLRPELPIDEAADAIGMRCDDFRAYVSEGAIPFRSTQYVDWVRLADVLDWENKRSAEQQAAMDELLGGDPMDDDGQS
ncbi:hypothetical protein JOF29_004073 [Kribbella aluminosa]|uniref:DNA-binding protein n=1 Tax=Kribbella aluminosa TaxID=416017 RepID=A0ABS4UN06_9ACTN|nr:hypothetical protein [Kribbella aluminosa]MBP2352990.1 hypothetical protein [Kribbella aluminosa]